MGFLLVIAVIVLLLLSRVSVHAPQLSMLRVLLVRTAACYPLRPLVPVSRDAPGVLDHPRQGHQVPTHESRVPVREVVLGTSGAGIEVRRARACLPDPTRVGLRRYHVAQ